MEMNNTGFKDVYGVDIKSDDSVLYERELYKVGKNPFTDTFAIGNDRKYIELVEVYEKCIVITLP
jgi:hypothetical protein